MSTNKQHLRVRALTEGAMLIGAAQVLSMLKLYEMPNGGSVTLGMLPILVFAVRWGLGRGLLAGFTFGLLQMFFDGAYALGWQSMLLDYLVAFTPLGLAGLFRGRASSIYLGTVVGSAARFLVHYVVGATIWAEYMPEEFFGMTMTTPWFYSMLYNGCYMLLDMILCLVAFWLLLGPMERYLLGQDLQ